MLRRSRVILAAAVSVLAAGGVAGAALAAGGTSVTVAGCLANGRITGVSVTQVPSCSASATPVQWPGQAVLPSSSPSPSQSPSPTGSPSPSPSSSPSPSPAGTGSWAWCSSAPGAFMQFGDLALYNQEDSGSGAQAMCGNSGSDWQVSVSDPAGNTGILSYPDVQLNYNTSPPALSSLDPSATSSFAEAMNATSGTSAEAAYDIWVDNGSSSRSEVMIWVDTVNRGTVGGASYLGVTQSFCGQSWQLWQYGGSGGELIWYLPGSEQSGQVCPAVMLQDLQSRGLLGAADTLSQYEFGWEIASTGGQAETFQVTSYSVSGLPAPN